MGVIVLKRNCCFALYNPPNARDKAGNLKGTAQCPHYCADRGFLCAEREA